MLSSSLMSFMSVKRSCMFGRALPVGLFSRKSVSNRTKKWGSCRRIQDLLQLVRAKMKGRSAVRIYCLSPLVSFFLSIFLSFFLSIFLSFFPSFFFSFLFFNRMLFLLCLLYFSFSTHSKKALSMADTGLKHWCQVCQVHRGENVSRHLNSARHRQARSRARGMPLIIPCIIVKNLSLCPTTMHSCSMKQQPSRQVNHRRLQKEEGLLTIEQNTTRMKKLRHQIPMKRSRRTL